MIFYILSCRNLNVNLLPTYCHQQKQAGKNCLIIYNSSSIIKNIITSLENYNHGQEKTTQNRHPLIFWVAKLYF
jgi:hypothetical protein